MRLLHLFGSLALGGTERVVVNRAQAAQRQGLDLRIDFHVPSASSQAIDAFERSVSAFGLEDHLRFSPTMDPAGYDAVLSMDFPEVYGRLQGAEAPVVAEAHQPRRDLQDYLRHLPPFVRLAAAPSASHAAFIGDLIPPHVALRVIPNAVIRPNPTWAASDSPKPPGGPRVVFCGRMGAVKDTAELVRVFAGVLAARPDAEPVIVTPSVHHAETEAALDATGMRERVALNRSVPFHAMGAFLDEVRASRGVFVSCSRAESFGLAAAEAIAAGVPVVLSDIPSHRALLAGAGGAALFPLGDTAGAVSRVLDALRGWDDARAAQAPASSVLCDERGALDALIGVVTEAQRLHP